MLLHLLGWLGLRETGEVVDADWAGTWTKQSSHDPLTAHSRTGFIIMYAGCPIAWSSRMQPLIALSTTEAEYIALSSSLKIFLPLKWLINEIIEHTKCDKPESTVLRSTVFKDNQSCHHLATKQQITTRTRHLQTSFHWFWSHVGKEFNIVKCPTDQMSADYLTKPMPKILFENNRMRVQGW